MIVAPPSTAAWTLQLSYAHHRVQFAKLWVLGSAPAHEQSVIGVILRALYNYVRNIIQPLMSGGSTQVGVTKFPYPGLSL